MALGTPVAGSFNYSGSPNPVYPATVNAGDALVLISGEKPLTANANGVTSIDDNGVRVWDFPGSETVTISYIELPFVDMQESMSFLTIG